MKRVLALVLALIMLFGMVPSMGTTAKAATEVTEKPFYGLTWDTLSLSTFGNLAYAPILEVKLENGAVKLNGSASSIKSVLDTYPEGMRYIRIFKTLNALKVADNVIYADKGVDQLKALVAQFVEDYYALGGKLDGIILDTEYTAMHNWYIYRDVYYATESEGEIENKNIYSDIVNDPRYLTEIRPLLEERGFVFHTPEPDHAKPERRSELFSIWPNQYLTSFPAYANCQAIWNKVMYNRIANYMTEAVYEPLIERYPDAIVSDYQSTDTATWENYMAMGGSLGNMSGNSIKAGNTSNYNVYNSGPSSEFFKDDDGNYLYKNVQSYNKAVYEDDPYNSLLFNVNRFKGMYNATDTKNVSVWVAEYDYSGRSTALKNNACYTEFLYHMGLLDPKPFLIYMYLGSSKFTGTEGKIAYNERMEVISQALAELTRVAGYSDRKPIATQQVWNDGFVLSGMYANGRNIWRLSPDTTDGMTLEAFKIADNDPTFSINGNTITFPGGTILTDATIQSVGSCGYWIETSADVEPVITREADRYAQYPSLLIDFEDMAVGTMMNSTDAKPLQTWSQSGISGVSLGNDITLNKNTTTGSWTIPTDISNSNPKIQKWSAKFKIASNTSSKAEVKLLMCGDGGFKVASNKIYYDNNGSYVEMEGVTISLNTTYQVVREVDFTTSGAFTCDYSVYSSSGTLLGSVQDVPMQNVSLPVTTLTNTGANLYSSVIASVSKDANITSGTITVPSSVCVENYNGSNVVGLTGNATLENLNLPKNITAGDSYAKYQAWEMSFVLPEALTTGSVTLFNGMVKLEGSKVYYNAGGSYVALADIAVGTKYTINVNNNFASNLATYTLSANGAVVAKAENITVPAVTLPVSSIEFACTGLRTKVYIDDYKLYPTGLEYTLKFYDGDTGVYQSATEKLTNDKVAYRLSWMNATAEGARGHLRLARYDSNGELVSDEPLKTIDMKAGWDGIETGVLENTTASLTVYLRICDDDTELKNQKDAVCGVEGYTGDLVCKTCGEILEKGEVIATTSHKKETIKGKSATCTQDGLTPGEKCSDCGLILKAQEVIPAKGHNIVVLEEGYPATCTTAGMTDMTRCPSCATFWDAEEIPALGHTESDPVMENVVAGSCTQDASYDLVVYCATCNDELSSEHIVNEAPGHVEQVLPGKEVTCTEDGMTEGKVCVTCGEVLVAQTTIYANGHIAAEPVKEKETATSYERVVYCTVCNGELSRETVNMQSATVTLWGTAVTIDTDNYTQDIPEALYWANGAKGEAPVAATAADNWNISFQIIDNVPTVTLRDVKYNGAYTFLSAKYDGNLKVVYEGTNDIVVPYNATSEEYRYFIYYASTTNSKGKGNLYIAGAENAVLNLTGGDNNAAMLNVGNKAYLTIQGGTINMEKTTSGGAYALIGASYSKTIIQDCTLNVKNTTSVSGKHPAVSMGGDSSLTITNANINIETNAHTGLCVGVFQSNMKGVLYAGKLTIDENSRIKVVADSNTTSDYAYNGVGIYAGTVTVKSGYVEVEAKKQAIYGTLVMTSYDGEYEMFTEKGGEAVSEYTTTTYFKVRQACDHTNTTTQETVVAATCTEAGSKTIVVTCRCGELISKETVAIPALGHTEEIIPGKDATCMEPGLTEGKKCTVCDKELAAQEEISALGHNEIIIPGYAATCTKAGMTDGKGCDTCGELIASQNIIPALGHTEEVIPGKEPTETETGLTEGKKCSVCGEILVAQEEIPATGTGECVEHIYDNDNDAVCNKCGFVRQLVDQFDFINYRVVFADSDTTHKNPRAIVYKLGDQTVADISNENALKAIDPSAETHWQAPMINKIQLTEAGNYVVMLKYNVGTATVSVPMAVTVDADPKLIIDNNNKLTVLDSNEDEIHGHLRVYIYYLGDRTVEDIYDTAALEAIDSAPQLEYHKMFIDKIALTKGGNYVVHLCWNIGTGPKITKAQQFSVFAIPTLTLDVNNMLWMSDDNAENNNHRLTIYKMADDLDIDSYDIYNETAVKDDAISTSKTYWGAAEINGLEIYERGNYIIHLNYSVGTSAKRTIAIGAYLNDRPVAGVTDENKLTMSFTDPDITNERVYYYYFGQNTTEGLDLYNKTALQNAAVSYTTNAIWTKNTIGKTELKELGNYVIHFEYNVKTYDENGNATGSAKKVVVVETTIYNPTKPVITLGEDNKLVASHDNPDAKNIRATIYKLGENTVEDIYDETALKAIDSAAATKWGLSEINKVALTDAGNYVILVKYNVGTATRTVAFQFTV